MWCLGPQYSIAAQCSTKAFKILQWTPESATVWPNTNIAVSHILQPERYLLCQTVVLIFFFFFSREKLPKVQLDQTALHLLLRKSTAAICAHVGYDGWCHNPIYNNIIIAKKDCRQIFFLFFLFFNRCVISSFGHPHWCTGKLFKQLLQDHEDQRRPTPREWLAGVSRCAGSVTAPVRYEGQGRATPVLEE